MWRKLKLFCVFLFMGIASLLPLVLSQGIRFPDQDLPGTGSSQSFLGSALSSITRNQLAIFDSLAPQATEDGGQPDNPESGVPRRHSGQILRLRGGSGPHTGFLQLNIQGTWQLVCDPESTSWGIPEANVVCRQLGFDSAQHIEHGNVSYADITIADTGIVLNRGIDCKGDEGDLRQCQLAPEPAVEDAAAGCSPAVHAVNIACNHPSVAHCPGNAIPFRRRCYDVISDDPKSFSEAQADCQQRSAEGGHLVEIRDQVLNDFLTELLLTTTTVTKIWTGGVVGKVAGKKFSLWFDSQDKIKFSNYFEEESDEQSSDENTVGDAGLPSSSGIQLFSMDGGYFFWNSTSNLEEKFAFVCESPQIDIGCYLEDLGADYNGSASRGDGGQPCLAWDTPGLTKIFEGQETWTHNFCRNPGGAEEGPICYVDEQNIDTCTIPKCGDISKRRDTATSNYLPDLCRNLNFIEDPEQSYSPIYFPTENRTSCSSEQFECRPGECVFAKTVCDGERDCSDGEDEENCLDYVAMFVKESGFKLQNKETVVVDVTEKECAKLCVQSKHCSCSSFSHHPRKNRCVLTNSLTNAAPFDALLERKSWNYFTLNTSINSWCNRVKRPAASQIEAIRLLSGREADLVEVKLDGKWGGICDDGFSFKEANVVCKQLGFELGAEQVINGQGQDPNDLPILHDIECSGNENHITDCDFGDHGNHKHECAGTEKAGLKCRKTSKSCDQFEWHCKNKECIHVNNLCDDIPHCRDGSDEDAAVCSLPFQVRLVDGPYPQSGRIEVRHKSVWGTICDDHFGPNEAAVVCRMLGYDDTDAKVYNGSRDYRGSGPVWIRLTQDEVCSGFEASIEDCKDKSLWSHDHHCTHAEDVAISCGPEVASGDLSSFPKDGHDNVNRIQSSEQLVADMVVPPPDAKSAFTVLKGVDECGVRKVDVGGLADVIPRITGGASANPGEHPWQASIRVQGQDDTYHWCGATIITKFKLLTAAHCLKEFPVSIYRVRVGDFSLNVLDREEKDFPVEKVDFHENYNVGPYLNNDIAIVTLSEKSGGITFGQTVLPVCLPSPKLSHKQFSNLTITGWGKVNYEGFSTATDRGLENLQDAQVPTIDNAVCATDKIYGRERLSVGMFCAGDLQGGGADACQGDSGGPAVGMVHGKATLIGITSWGYGCGRQNKPGVYTQVSQYVGWIEKKLGNK